MDTLTEAQKNTAINNFIYKKNYYNKYQKENKDKLALAHKKYFDNIRNDEEKRLEYKRKKQDYYERVGRERYLKQKEQKKLEKLAKLGELSKIDKEINIELS